MKVKLLSHTPNPEHLTGLAARACWSERGASKITVRSERLQKLLKREVEREHESVIEHATFTFSIEGVSRACTHQLVRHRIASYSQQSQRQVKVEEPKYITPPQIKKSSVRRKFDKAMSEAWRAYRELLEEGISQEDARFVLPNAAKTNIVVTMNARSLLNFFELRCCLHAQWEIRTVANEMLSKVKEVAPIIFEKAGPQCKSRGTCPENDPDCPLYERYILNEKSPSLE